MIFAFLHHGLDPAGRGLPPVANRMDAPELGWQYLVEVPFLSNRLDVRLKRVVPLVSGHELHDLAFLFHLFHGHVGLPHRLFKEAAERLHLSRDLLVRGGVARLDRRGVKGVLLDHPAQDDRVQPVLLHEQQQRLHVIPRPLMEGARGDHAPHPGHIGRHLCFRFKHLYGGDGVSVDPERDIGPACGTRPGLRQPITAGRFPLSFLSLLISGSLFVRCSRSPLGLGRDYPWGGWVSGYDGPGGRVRLAHESLAIATPRTPNMAMPIPRAAPTIATVTRAVNNDLI